MMAALKTPREWAITSPADAKQIAKKATFKELLDELDRRGAAHAAAAAATAK